MMTITNVTDGQTDRQTDRQHTLAIPRYAHMCIARQEVGKTTGCIQERNTVNNNNNNNNNYYYSKTTTIYVQFISHYSTVTLVLPISIVVSGVV